MRITAIRELTIGLCAIFLAFIVGGMMHHTYLGYCIYLTLWIIGGTMILHGFNRAVLCTEKEDNYLLG